ncbi:hypothetical protein Pcinc_027958 [Petrolisthes cinctipes]|uniref:Peptide-N(4)-(N-acetyl-beta-glucosaminyl)asparagine amidase n=1 Tax=Petrolisthes cinctipes TaxID=88211 RepID=A0AAE1K9L0_PETCI|nr:hypothetical protein Pcinc_027958 [Petrolisthes cinctipes]
MDENSSCVESLLDNDPQVMEEAVNLLLKIADNILKEPENKKYRQVSLKNKQVNRFLIPAVGALEVLFLMGFQEEDDHLLLSLEQPLDQLRQYRHQLLRLKERNPISAVAGVPEATASTVPLASGFQFGRVKMQERLSSELQRVAVYESTGLQQKAREVMPVQRLHQLARDKMAAVNKDLQEGATELDFQDCVLMELLKWFKEEFFRWFDAPTCTQCQRKMTACGTQSPSQEDLIWAASRVELYSCKDCGTYDKFVRYNNPGKLLETREGRCGEWANCFTLFCRTLGMDARYVLDFTDHVWTEVYSQSQRRWLHTDCCEGKMDTPIMYEKGWKHKLTYIFAFSKDEVVDVTWRYTANQKEVLKRRKECDEIWLVTCLMELNRNHQATFTQEKRNFLQFRMVTEIAEFLRQDKTTKDGECEGRQSGSLAWRLSRGETKNSSKYTFKLSKQEEEKREFLVKYSVAQDEYLRVSAAGGEENKENLLKGWQAGTHSAKDIFRKHETDWKFVYLARIEGSSEGKISWCVDWSHTNLKVKKVMVILQHTTYESGCVTWQVCTGDKCTIGDKGGVLELGGSEVGNDVRRLEVSAVLSGGCQENAWQHAQLCRQLDSTVNQFPFLINIMFQK